VAAGSRASDALDEDERGPRELELHEVVRHLRGDAHRRRAFLAKVQFDHGAYVPGHFDLPDDGQVPGHEMGFTAVHRDAQGPGMRDRPRHPLVVGLGTGEQEESVSRSIGHLMQHDLLHLDRGEVIHHKGHARAARPIVEQLVNVEGRRPPQRRRSRRRRRRERVARRSAPHGAR